MLFKPLKKCLIIVFGLLILGAGLLYVSQTLLAKTLLRVFFFSAFRVRTEVALCFLTPFPPSLKIAGLSLQSLDKENPLSIKIDQMRLQWHWPSGGGIPWSLKTKMAEGTLTGNGLWDPFKLSTEVDLVLGSYPLIRVNALPRHYFGLQFIKGLLTLRSKGTINIKDVDLQQSATLTDFNFYLVDRTKFPDLFSRGLRFISMMGQPFTFPFSLKGSLLSPQLNYRNSPPIMPGR